jgi:NAD(P)-dependent dehydrogenase (short-subunit alcohol dehydrogenase family)
MVDILHLTPDEVAEEIPTSLLPPACGAASAKSYRDKEVRPLVWLIFGGTGALGRQVSKVAIGRHDKVMIAALDEEYDCGEWEITDDESERQVIDGDEDENASGLHNGNNKRPSSTPDQATISSRQKRPKITNKVPLPSPFLYIGKQFRGSCKRIRCDVRIKSSVDDAIQECLKEFGKIDVVVNCFGYGVVGACEDQIDSEVRSQFEVNFMGLFHTLRAVLPYLTNDARNKAGESNTPGHIISFTSSMGVLGAPGFGPYSATRWAAEGLLESFAIEVEHTGCKVTIIETGYAKSGTPEDKISVARP